MQKSQTIGFLKAVKSFQGFLEGSGKALNTQESYLLDLSRFREFALKRIHPKGAKADFPLTKLSLKLIEEFQGELKKDGLKINSRRRATLTLRRFVRYLKGRKMLDVEWEGQLPAPAKSERLPRIPDYEALMTKIKSWPTVSALDLRNRALFWTLLETGLIATEVVSLKWADWKLEEAAATLTVPGKRTRRLEISRGLYQAVQDLKEAAGLSKKFQLEFCFLGHNRFGPMPTAMSPRGLEHQVKSSSAKLGDPQIVPRDFRHACAFKMFSDGVAKTEIKRRMGWESEYSFRLYEPLLAGRTKSKT